MANLKTSQLPPAGTIDGTETIGIVQGGINVKTTLTTALASSVASVVATVTATLGQQVVNVAALRALAVPTSATSVVVEGYTAAGDFGGGTFIFSPTSLAFDDNVIIFKPNTLIPTTPGRWVRQLPAGFITPEMGGAVGDYIFPQQAWAANTAYIGGGLIQNGPNVYYCTSGGTSASSVGPTGTASAIVDGTVIWQYKGVADTGTNNSPAFINLVIALTFVANNGLDGGVIRLLPGKAYLFSTDFTLVSGIVLEGTGMANISGSATSPFTAIITSGSCLVVDPTITFELAGLNGLKNLKIIRRGLKSTPTTAEVNTLWATCASEMSPGKVWAASTAYTAGNIVSNMGNVYICDTSGTSGVAGTGGPLTMVKTVNGVIDGTAKWHFLNQLPWLGNTAYVAGTIVTSGPHVYVCDTSGTSANNTPASAIFGAGPFQSGTSSVVNSIVDGTAKWHHAGKISVGVMADTLCRFENIVVYGFAKGILLPRGCDYIRNCYMDNFMNLDVSGTGDTNIFENVHCVPIYSPQDSPINSNWIRKQSVGMFFHDDVDSPIIRDCEVEFIAVGIRLSNVWGATVTDCRVETASFVWGDSCYQTLNQTAFIEFNNCYAGGVIAYDIQSTDFAHAQQPCINQTRDSSILIHGGQVGVPPPGGFDGTGGTPTHFRIQGNATGSITDLHVNMQGQTPFTVLPWSNTGTFWNIQNIRIDEDTVHPTYGVMASIDATAAPFIHFAGMWDSQMNRWIVPPGHDDSPTKVVVATGFSNTISTGCSRYILTPAGTLATGTLVMPATPAQNQVLTIMTTQTITALTLSPNTAQTISAAPTTLAANTAVRFVYSGTNWYREM